MISNIKVNDFKSLKEISIETKNLNLLMGLNGMGKSSLIQVLLLINQSRYNLFKIRLNGEHIHLGKQKDILYQYSNEDKITFDIKFKDTIYQKFLLSFEYEPESEILIDPITEKAQILVKPTGYLFDNNFKYLSAERIGPKTIHNKSYGHVVTDKQIGLNGEFTVHYLNTYGNQKVADKNLHHSKARSEILLHQVEAWMSEISPGVKLNTTEIPGTDNVLLDVQFETENDFTKRFSPLNVGFGISYILPVITLLLSSKKNDLLIIENPESHIHPKGQSALGKLIGLVAESKRQLFVETHSEHILNGIRVVVKDGIISKENVGVFYFEKVNQESEQYTQITSIRIDKNGELSEYPKNFLDEWSNQLVKLV